MLCTVAICGSSVTGLGISSKIEPRSAVMLTSLWDDPVLLPASIWPSFALEGDLVSMACISSTMLRISGSVTGLRNTLSNKECVTSWFLLLLAFAKAVFALGNI